MGDDAEMSGDALSRDELLGTMGYGQSRTATFFSSASTRRAYAFQGQVGDRVDIWVRSVEGDAFASLLKADEASITTNDDGGAATFDSHLVATLPTSGTYYIQFSNSDFNETATFNVSLEGERGCSSPDCGPSSSEAPLGPPCEGRALASSAAWESLRARASTLSRVALRGSLVRYARKCGGNVCEAWQPLPATVRDGLNLGPKDLPASWAYIDGGMQLNERGAAGWTRGRRVSRDGHVDFTGGMPRATVNYSYWGRSEADLVFPVGETARITNEEQLDGLPGISRTWEYPATVVVTDHCIDIRATIPWVGSDPSSAFHLTRIVGEEAVAWHAEY